MFFIYTTPKEQPAIVDMCLNKTHWGKSRDYRDVIVFSKFLFPPRENQEPAFLVRFEERFWKAPFSWGPEK